MSTKTIKLTAHQRNVLLSTIHSLRQAEGGGSVQRTLGTILKKLETKRPR